MRVSEYKESAITLSLRVWTLTEHYFDLKDDLIEEVKAVFDKNHICIPYSQVDIHIKEHR